MAALMILVDWPETGDTEPGVCGLLACGHYASPVHECSSDWDFPDEVKVCHVCGAETQFDLRLQAALYNNDIVDADDRTEGAQS